MIKSNAPVDRKYSPIKNAAHAQSVPTVPGAYGAKPLPKPNARARLGLLNTHLMLGIGVGIEEKLVGVFMRSDQRIEVVDPLLEYLILSRCYRQYVSQVLSSAWT